MTNKADVSKLRDSARNTDSYRKDLIFREIAAIDPATGRAVVTARIYFPNATAYCALWVNAPNAHGRGLGKAGGGGYHKPSAALADAIRDAGITLTQAISGVGDSAMEAACEAIARAVTGKRRFIIHVAHA